jgi:DNA modification methylase
MNENLIALELLDTILVGDWLDKLKSYPDKCAHTCVTSPPYYALRNYGVDGQLGLENTPEEYIEKMVIGFREIRRILVDTGTLWLNIGDSYWGGKGKSGQSYSAEAQQERWEQGSSISRGEHQIAGKGITRPTDRKHPEIKSKDMIGIPWMLAFALRKDGWYLRQDIIWNKPNPMPESVQDRCTKSHEYIFLFSKSQRYYYDAFSIATPYADKTLSTFSSLKPTYNRSKDIRRGYGDDTGLVASQGWSERAPVRQPKKWNVPGMAGISDKGGNQANAEIPPMIEGGKANKKSVWSAEDPYMVWDWLFDNAPYSFIAPLWEKFIQDTENKSDVWRVATKPFKDAHFATFPKDLIRDCIKAGCPVGEVVLDPFMGAHTTAITAKELDRHYIGTELNPKYMQIGDNRQNRELGLLK